MKTSTRSMLYVPIMMSAVFYFVSFQAAGQNQRGYQRANSIFEYSGIEAAFGLTQFTLQSDIPELQDLAVTEEGGSAAFIFGNRFSRITAGAGLYYSTAGTKRTIDQVKLELQANIYLLQALKIPSQKADVYLLTGVSNEYVKFFGHYIDETERASRNGAAGREPYLGKIVNTQIDLGMGVEYRLESQREFIHFFVEGQTNFDLSGTAEIMAFNNTSLEDTYTVNVGLRFGRIK